MRFSGVVLAAATLCSRVAKADFMLYTTPPIPTSLVPTGSSEAASFTSSVLLNGFISWRSYTNGLGPEYKSSESSALSEISAFAATASNYSVPAPVTDPETTTTIIQGTAPAWYTAMPSGARQFKEQQVEDQFSIVREVIARRQSSSSTGGVMPTARPGVKELGVAAAAAAAAFL